MTRRILIVDDDPVQRRLMREVVSGMGYEVREAGDGDRALDALHAPEKSDIVLVLLDLRMPGTDGMTVLRTVKPRQPDLPFIVLTAQGGIDTAVNAMRAGADDFIVKPANPERIRVSIGNALKVSVLNKEISRLTRRDRGSLTFDDLISRSPAMRRAIELGQRAAQSNIPILITGESGVGKELMARAIQGESDRAGKPFVTVNCGAIPDNLVESILFGHEKGAFTGATGKHMGKFQEAHGGTLFLDEIGELRMDMQVKLLRALQDGEVDPVGATRPVKVDIRLISATNRDLARAVAEGNFREDLYYRLNVFPIHMAPLRERREDIPELIEHFIERFAASEGKRVPSLTQEAEAALTGYDWPGNIRQLENAIFRAVVLSDNGTLDVGDFPQVAQDRALGQPVPVAAPPPREPEAAGAGAPGQEEGALVKAPEAEEVPDHIDVLDPSGHMRPLDEIEGAMIRLAIDRYSGQMSEVARRLGIGRSTLYRKIRDLGLEPRRNRAG
ncbi:MAG: sigma-54-dependent transcriptional regulator [Alphaproteobacteria bacterium]